jgi:hypothetical protein
MTIEAALEMLTREARAGFAAMGMDPDTAMGEYTITGPNGKTFYYDGTPEDREIAIREAELEV